MIKNIGSVPELGKNSLPQLANSMHEIIVLMQNKWASVDAMYAFIVAYIETWLKARNIDLWQIIDQKMKINKDRPRLHGRLY